MAGSRRLLPRRPQAPWGDTGTPGPSWGPGSLCVGFLTHRVISALPPRPSRQHGEAKALHVVRPSETEQQSSVGREAADRGRRLQLLQGQFGVGSFEKVPGLCGDCVGGRRLPPSPKPEFHPRTREVRGEKRAPSVF